VGRDRQGGMLIAAARAVETSLDHQGHPTLSS
jgi:hypothetical protein